MKTKVLHLNAGSTLKGLRILSLTLLITMLSFVTVKAQNTVVDIIVGSEDHTTLEAAVIAADLATTLSGDGPFSVFAPTDAAFAMLPDGTLDALLADPSGALTDILLYHVIGASVMSTDLSDGQMATTLLLEDVTVTINNDGVFINDAQVTVADIVASNGVVHVIDIVLIYDDGTTGFFEKETTKISVFPNPSSDFINVSFDSEEDQSFKIYSLEGRTVKTFDNVRSGNSLNISDVKEGTYLLMRESGSSISASKVMIQR